MTAKIILWVCIFIIAYAYAGYTLILFITSLVYRLLRKHQSFAASDEPAVTLVIPAYNEAVYIDAKVRNTLELDYPHDKLDIIWITDGSTDDSARLLMNYPRLRVMHEKERKGKIHAMNRSMSVIHTPIVIFTDANSMLNRMAVRELVRHFSNPGVGCVAGEKRIKSPHLEKAVDAGEGLYWNYESLVKSLESSTGSAMGAVGELFAIRHELYEPVSADTILDDFSISLQIASRGYLIKYAPGAWGIETASVSIREEMKRKSRIAAGGLQTVFRMPWLINPFKNPGIAFRYVSHKLLRWTLVPLAFPVIFLLNLFIVISPGLSSGLYLLLFAGQCLFYLLAITGALLHNVRRRFRLIFAPYYLLAMNYAILKGLFGYFSGKQTAIWQKVKRG